jgi:hypothetical protein
MPDGAGEELLDLLTAVDGRPVPDHQQARSDVPDQVLEELDGVQPVERLLTYQGVDLAGRRDSAHDREVVARLPLVEDRRVPLGGVGPDLARQEVEARFIHENQGAALAAGLVLEPRPDRDAPLLDLLLVALDGPRNRQLGRPAQFLPKPGDVTLVVGDAELLFDDLGDAGTGPDLAAKAVGFRPVRKEVGDETQLIRFELGGRAEVGSREQRSRTFAARRRNLPAYRPLGDTEGDGDLPLLPTELLEAPGLHSPPLSPVLRVGALGVHTLLYGPKNFTFLRNAQ